MFASAGCLMVPSADLVGALSKAPIGAFFTTPDVFVSTLAGTIAGIFFCLWMRFHRRLCLFFSPLGWFQLLFLFLFIPPIWNHTTSRFSAASESLNGTR